MTRFHPLEYALYHNGNGQHIGSNALEVRDWLAAHPEYQGRIYGDFNTGGSRDQFEATDQFEDLLAENAERLEKLDATLADLARGDEHFRPVPTPETDIIRTVRRVA